MTEEEQAEQFGKAMADAFGGLIQKGYVIQLATKDKPKPPGGYKGLSDVIAFSDKAWKTYGEIKQLAHDADYNDDEPDNAQYVANFVNWLAGQGYESELNGWELYGLLSWGGELAAELEVRRTMPDGYVRWVRKQAEEREARYAD